MATRQIVTVGAEVLREKAKIVTEFSERLWTLLDDMRETMILAKGVGLAAPQVGILKRVAVVSTDDGKTVYELVNPVIVKSAGSQIEEEGCLSVPGRVGFVERPLTVAVKAQDRFGKPIKIKTEEGDPFLAIVFCHEIDHLDGVLYTDKAIEGYKPPENSDK
ncbi:MAG: peptide deformylase [Firmicutes bacterium]|nr:peptide deformylase [Bacillota bacterium]